MTFKSDARGVKVDWEKVALATEIARTYEITLESGGIIFKMYKPSEFKKIRANKNDPRLKKWVKVRLVGKAV